MNEFGTAGGLKAQFLPGLNAIRSQLRRYRRRARACSCPVLLSAPAGELKLARCWQIGGFTPLHQAVYEGSDKLVKLLLEYADENACNLADAVRLFAGGGASVLR